MVVVEIYKKEGEGSARLRKERSNEAVVVEVEVEKQAKKRRSFLVPMSAKYRQEKTSGGLRSIVMHGIRVRYGDTSL